MRAFTGKDMTTMHDRLCSRLVNATADQLDVISNVDVQVFHVMARADSMEWDFDLKRMWLTPSRWTMMINQYVDAVFLREWIDKCVKHIGTKGRGIAHMRFKEVRARGGKEQGNKETRRWGSCMLGLSYHAVPEPTITFFSRTSYLGYLSGLDLSVAYTCARYLAVALGADVEEFKFVWMLQAAQFHNFKSLAYMLCHPDEPTADRYYELLVPTNDQLTDEAKKTLESCPTLRLSRTWLQKLLAEDRRGDSYGVTRYNTYRRIRRRFHTEVMGLKYAKQFEGWSYYREGDKEVLAGRAQPGEQKEWFGTYQQLPHKHVRELNFDRLGVDLIEGDGSDFEDSAEEDED